LIEFFNSSNGGGQVGASDIRPRNPSDDQLGNQREKRDDKTVEQVHGIPFLEGHYGRRKMRLMLTFFYKNVKVKVEAGCARKTFS